MVQRELHTRMATFRIQQPAGPVHPAYAPQPLPPAAPALQLGRPRAECRVALPLRHRRAARDAAYCRHWDAPLEPGAIMRTLLGEPTGTSPKFAGALLERS